MILARDSLSGSTSSIVAHGGALMMFETEGSRKSPDDHVEQTAEEGSTPSRSHERQLVTRFDSREIRGSDFAGAAEPGGKFKVSMLRGSDYSHADLTGSSFTASDVADANFDG